jgi:ubiquinone/menaquinone biosynthesis C-methylase UbiE
MKINQVGEAWREYYLGETTTWCDPDRIDSAFFTRHAQSEWITKMLKYTHVQPVPDTRVLEAGCGTAQYALMLALMGCAVDAFDYSEEALRFARKLEAKARQINPNLIFNLTLGNLLEIQSADNVYNLVFNQGVIDYFTSAEERSQALREMMRVAKPGGWVAVIAQHTGHPFRRWWERWGWEGYTH